jgi:hypothetical protein
MKNYTSNFKRIYHWEKLIQRKRDLGFGRVSWDEFIELNHRDYEEMRQLQRELREFHSDQNEAEEDEHNHNSATTGNDYDF